MLQLCSKYTCQSFYDLMMTYLKLKEPSHRNTYCVNGKRPLNYSNNYRHSLWQFEPFTRTFNIFLDKAWHRGVSPVTRCHLPLNLSCPLILLPRQLKEICWNSSYQLVPWYLSCWWTYYTNLADPWYPLENLSAPTDSHSPYYIPYFLPIQRENSAQILLYRNLDPWYLW